MKYLIAALAVSIALPAFGQGQPSCYPRADVVSVLGGKYGESVQSRGIAANGSLIEMWANVDTGTWTAVVSTPGGPSCVVASGNSFQRSDNAPSPQGQDG